MVFQQSKKYNLFYGEATAVYNYMFVNYERLNLNYEALVAFANDVSEYTNLYFQYTRPDRRTATVVREIAEMYEKTHAELAKFRRQLVNDASITLTDADIVNLRVKPRGAKRKRAETPMYSPHNEVIHNLSMTVSILTYTLDVQGVRQTSMPEQRMRIERRLAITDSAALPAMAEYHSIGPSTRSRYRLTFTPEQVDQHVHLITAYQNSVGQRGPWSAPLTFQVND